VNSKNKLETAKTLATSSKIKERMMVRRKSLINLRDFIIDVQKWQQERPPLMATDQDMELLIVLLLAEIEEVAEHRNQEGLDGYDFISEKSEIIDAGFFLACFDYLLKVQGDYLDYSNSVKKANGQANGSHALDVLREVGGNITEKNLAKDMQYLWTLWISYLIHMKYPVNPNQVLVEQTFPKNNGNYSKELLQGNPLFERAFGRKMNREEKIAYFAHYRKAVRLIRDFMITHIDAKIEYNGLKARALSTL
jgi:hypothetical protein